MKHGKPLLALPDEIIASFWARVIKGKRKTDCWGWIGDREPNSYGRVSYSNEGKRSLIKAHRISCFIHHGSTPVDKPDVLHSCDNKICTNPLHIAWGTNQQNQADFIARSDGPTRPRGSQHSNSKLTERLVADILISAESGNAIALRLGLDRSTVNKVRAGILWGHMQKAGGLSEELIRRRKEWRKENHRLATQGQSHPSAVLTNKEVLKIRASTASNRVMANEFGVSIETIQNIRNRKTWTHI